MPECGVQVAVPMSSRLEGQLEAKRAVGRDSKTLLLTFSLPSRGSSLGQEVLRLPVGKPERISENPQPQSFSLDWREDLWAAFLGTQREVCARQATRLAILVTARPLPVPGLPQDQPQRFGRQPGPPFPAW